MSALDVNYMKRNQNTTRRSVNRAHASPVDVLRLLESGDKTSKQIIRTLGISANQWTIMRGQMLKAKLIGIVHGRGQYTLLRKDDEK